MMQKVNDILVKEVKTKNEQIHKVTLELDLESRIGYSSQSL